jgi:glycosyltransferase involved in cell wall biosynthesis
LGRYLSREFGKGTDVRLRIVPTRSSDDSKFKHLSTLPALVMFTARCAKTKPDIVHLNVAPRGSTYRKYLFWLAARACGSKTVLHLHGSGYDEFFHSQRPRLQKIIRHFFHGADHVVVLGDHWKKFVIQEIGVAPSRISIVYNGVPEPNPSTEPKWDPPLLMTIGLVGERKGTDVLIEALSGLSTPISWHMVIAGNGEVEKFRGIAQAVGLGDRIDFLEWVDEKAVDLWLNRASIFVLPSRAENQPVAILEAMARDVPVIATDVGAIPEQVVDGETGLLVPPGEAEPLRAAIAALLASGEQRAVLGVAARRRYEERFSIAQCARALESVYRCTARTPQ